MELFTQVVLFLRRAGLARLSTVAIDLTRVKAQASPDRLLRQDRLEEELRQKVEHWQRHLEDDPDREPGTQVGQEQIERGRQQLQQLRQSGESKLSRTDAKARFLRARGGRFVLGYTAEVAVSEDYFIVAQQVLADTGFFCNQNLRERGERGIATYLPDPWMARELNTGQVAVGARRMTVSDPSLQRSRQRLRTPEGRAWYRIARRWSSRYSAF